MWFQRFFGDTKHFGLAVELHDDPHAHPSADPLRLASWGRLQIWVQERCLTHSVQSGAAEPAIEWYLDDFVRWAAGHLIPLLNEEPFPNPTRNRVGSGADWVLESESAPWTMRATDEDRWFSQRWDWRARHELSAAFPDADVPYVVIRRLGAFIEFSWDNETWAPSRKALRFTEPNGAAHVGAPRVAQVLSDALSALMSAIEGRAGASFSLPLPRATRDDWRWLVPRPVHAILRTEPCLAGLVKGLDSCAEAAGLVVPHSVATLLLRDCPHASASDVITLLDLPTHTGWAAERLVALRDPHPAPRRRPWVDGYEAALRLRKELGWGFDPAPDDLRAWLEELHVDVTDHIWQVDLDSVLVARTSCRPVIGVNRESKGARRMSPRMLTAAALGVWLLDALPGADFAFTFSPSAHWPTLARSKAFAAMLLMPEEGVRAFLNDQKVSAIDAPAVRALMDHFGTTVPVTLNHLNHMRLIGDDERVELEDEIRAA